MPTLFQTIGNFLGWLILGGGGFTIMGIMLIPASGGDVRIILAGLLIGLPGVFTFLFIFYPPDRKTKRSESQRRHRSHSDIVSETSTSHKPTPKETCPLCGRPLSRTINRFTRDPFLGCDGFPYCRYTKNISEGESI